MFESLWGRILYELRTNVVFFLWDTGRENDTNTTYACTEVPTATHISLYLPPRHTHTRTHTQTYTHTHSHTQTHTYPQWKQTTPLLDPHPHTARPHTLTRITTLIVSR